MSKMSISRREFVGLTSVAAALGATSIGTKLEADPSNSVSVEVNLPPGRKLGTDAEMAMAKDWARSFSGSVAGTQAQAGIPFDSGSHAAAIFLHLWWQKFFRPSPRMEGRG